MGARNKPLGHVQVTGTTTGTLLSALVTAAGGTLPGAASWVLINPAAEVRFRDDGVAPTSAVGITLPADSIYMYDGDLDAIRIAATVGTPLIDVSFYAGSPNR